VISIIGYSLSLLVGFSLGLVGGGGSILVIPILVYCFHMDPAQAVSYSLFIVGLSACSGSIGHIRQKTIDRNAAFNFGIPSVITLFLVRGWLVKQIPLVLYQHNSVLVSRQALMMTIFSILMVAAGVSMIRGKVYSPEDDKLSRPLLIFRGAITGAITGFIGIGGGFIIVPSLVLFAGLPMRKAIGTSLAIITLNCLVGILSNREALDNLDYGFLFRFASLAIIGILLGTWFIHFVPDKRLKPIFGIIILLMSVLVIMRIFIHAS